MKYDMPNVRSTNPWFLLFVACWYICALALIFFIQPSQFLNDDEELVLALFLCLFPLAIRYRNKWRAVLDLKKWRDVLCRVLGLISGWIMLLTFGGAFVVGAFEILGWLSRRAWPDVRATAFVQSVLGGTQLWSWIENPESWLGLHHLVRQTVDAPLWLFLAGLGFLAILAAGPLIDKQD
jgi:hypothetical protein